ncbi:MAG: deoxyhypusine synthase family protein [Planctomycetes bacterium]|nr:deoxyhypusine synthase family protein [Planctomycetota bacterium]
MTLPELSRFGNAPDIVPLTIRPGTGVPEFIDLLGGSCFEARVLARGARLWRSMIDDGASTWLGIAGAGIAGGLGGLVVQLLRNGFIDVVCTTGAQAYHDLHFAFGLPVKAVSPIADDDELRRSGDTRIYDIGIREKETLEAQDDIICRFIRENYSDLSSSPLSSPRFMKLLGDWTAAVAPHPEYSFVAAAAAAAVPVFWDSFTNHSIALNSARMETEGFPLAYSPHADILLSAALAFAEPELGFVELGGGGPKNFIQQTGPTISQILGVKDYDGASRGLQISTANVREGSLSSCTFGEAVTWGKYRADDDAKLVQLWGEYSILFPLLAAYVLDRCEPRTPRRLYDRMDSCLAGLEAAAGKRSAT